MINHGIPRPFIERALASFMLYNGSEPETQFRQHILNRWRDTQQRTAKQSSAHAFEIATPAPFDRDWIPSQDALDILAQADIDIIFAESVRAEFILYWSERGGPPKEVNSRFVEHVRRRWLKHTSQMHHSTEPTRIPRNWEPDTSVYETLRLAGIEQADAQALLPEFVMYWVDSNEVHTSWNSKFLQHVKRQCRGAGYGEQHGGETGRSGAGGGHRSKDRSLSDDLTDTSWATDPTEPPDSQLIEAINQVFALFRLNYHNQYYAAWSDAEQVKQVKRLWLEALDAYPTAVILRAAQHAIEQRLSAHAESYDRGVPALPE